MYSIRSVLIFLTLFVLSLPVFSQEQNKELAREYMIQAEEIMNATKAIDDAREIMITAADLDTTYLKANYDAGLMHLNTINKGRSVKYFQRVFRQDPSYRFDIEYRIGEGYQYALDFEKALKFYNLYREKLTEKANYQGRDKIDIEVVERAIYECENGLEFVINPGNFSIVNIGREINSEYEDYAPVLNEAEDEIVFTTRRREDNMNENVYDDNKPWEDIFIAKKVDGKWQSAKNIGAPVNTPYHNSNTALTADGKTLFLYLDEGNGDIYFTKNENGVWTEPQPIPGVVNSTFEEKSVSISKDQKTIYFSSNRPGGFGELDIYRATLDSKGQWGDVKNLGPKINTDLNDDAPFIDYDGVTFYYSSEGRKGMGGYDIFKTTFSPGTNEWSEPENLGYPINTPDNDIYFVTSKDSKRAYYSSVREDGIGYTDIYMITIPEGLKNPTPVVPPVVVAKEPDTQPDPVVTVPVVVKNESKAVKYIVTVVDGETSSPLEAKVRMAGSKDNVVVGMNSKGNGVYEFNVSSKSAKEYRLTVERDGYAFQNIAVQLDGASDQEKTVNRTVEMRKLAVTVSGILRNIYFDFDKATFKTQSYAELNMLENMLRSNPGMSVEIGGHTDAIGTKDYNLFLSRKRAEAVKDFLTKKGIDARRIKAVGYGKTRPLASNDDEAEGRQFNRRVEFKVLTKQ
jgi:outer membrane protein OmpA-like peptidoglycan-associated protein/tetratricopeptide (TPR) repeat protein